MDAIERILENPEKIKFAFQPVVSASTGEIFGYEALMRADPFSPLEVIDYCIKTKQLVRLEEITMLYSIKAFLRNNLEKMDKKHLKEKYRYKLHYIYREFDIDFFKMDLRSLPKNTS